MKRIPLLLLAGCSSLVDEGRAVPAWEGVRYVGPRDATEVGLALTAWDGELRRWTGDRARLTDTVIDEREGVPGDGYMVPGRLHADADFAGWALILHEATHEHLRVTTGDPDRTHRDGAGPWTALHDEAIEQAAETAARCER
jgi:hypothetical protein